MKIANICDRISEIYINREKKAKGECMNYNLNAAMSGANFGRLADEIKAMDSYKKFAKKLAK